MGKEKVLNGGYLSGVEVIHQLVTILLESVLELTTNLRLDFRITEKAIVGAALRIYAQLTILYELLVPFPILHLLTVFSCRFSLVS